MTPKERAAMQQALEACKRNQSAQAQAILEEALAGDNMTPTEQATVKESLTTQEQEPVAWRSKENGSFCTGGFLCGDVYKWTPLYAAPVRTKDLTDVDLWNLWEKSDSNVEFARAAIAADREKNK